MSIEQMAVILRIIAMLGCLLAFWLLASSAYRQWHAWNKKTKNHWFALVGWTFFGFYATFENLVLNLKIGSRSIVLMLVIVFTLRALLIDDNLKASSSVPWKGDPNK